jgi:hypothetical protein|tara:strand:+ start:3367 stop:3657 length:291 start_codon:yes stop_codon:yes gene_type:complete
MKTNKSKYKVYCVQDHWYLNEETDIWEENGSCECNFMRDTHEEPITEEELYDRFESLWEDTTVEDKLDYVRDNNLQDFIEDTWGVEIKLTLEEVKI